MARLFESFVRNFLRIERPDLSVESEELDWLATSDTDTALALLPQMRTDISVRSTDRTLVIDTKFYADTFQTHHEKQSVHSSHLYQLTAYLRNMEERPGPDGSAEGMLLYPVTSNPVHVEYKIQGHKVQICTVDLSKQWQQIDAELASIF